MAKDPAFLFYPGDFLTGVSELTMEERGQYITLLCLQHQKGHLSDKLIRLSCGNAAADVMAKFRQDDDGLYFNTRLDVEIEKRKEHSNKQKERATNGWIKRKQNDAAASTTANATALPLEDINENENRIKDKVEDEKKSEAKKSLIPDNFPFKSPYAIKAMEDYITHRRQLKVKTYTAIGLQKAMEEWEKWGEANFIEAVNNSIKNNYQGIFLPTQNPSSNGQQHKSPTVKRFTGGVDPPPPGTPFGQL